MFREEVKCDGDGIARRSGKWSYMYQLHKRRLPTWMLYRTQRVSKQSSVWLLCCAHCEDDEPQMHTLKSDGSCDSIRVRISQLEPVQRGSVHSGHHSADLVVRDVSMKSGDATRIGELLFVGVDGMDGSCRELECSMLSHVHRARLRLCGLVLSPCVAFVPSSFPHKDNR